MKDIQKIIKELKDEDFLEGLHDTWQIYIKNNENSLERSYLNNTTFTSKEAAEDEKERIKRHQIRRNETPYFSIEVRSHKTRKLKKPISVS